MGTNTVDLTNSTTTMEKLSILRSEKLKLLNPRYFPGPNIRDARCGMEHGYLFQYLVIPLDLCSVWQMKCASVRAAPKIGNL